MADAVDGLHEAGWPDPAAVATPAEFVQALRRLQRGSGLSYREVEKRASHAGNPLPRSTLTAALARSTLPRENIVVALIHACGGDEEQVQRWVAARRRIASAPSASAPSDSAPSASAPADAAATGASVAASAPAAVTLPVLGRTRVPRTRTGVVVLVLAVTALAVIVGRLLVAPAEEPDGAAPGQSGDVAPTQGTPLARDQPCPDGWLCLYEHPRHNRDRAGRMLKFQDDYWQPLREWDFDNHASSVRNLLGREACLAADWPVGASKLRVAPATAPATLSDWDNQASGIKLGPC